MAGMGQGFTARISTPTRLWIWIALPVACVPAAWLVLGGRTGRAAFASVPGGASGDRARQLLGQCNSSLNLL
jgi:hypothetical protein